MFHYNKQGFSNLAAKLLCPAIFYIIQQQLIVEHALTMQVCVVQPKAEIDLQYESSRLSTTGGYIAALLLGVTTLGTIAVMSGFFLEPDATFEDYISRVLPLAGGFVTIIGVSEVCCNPYKYRLRLIQAGTKHLCFVYHWVHYTFNKCFLRL